MKPALPPIVIPSQLITCLFLFLAIYVQLVQATPNHLATPAFKTPNADIVKLLTVAEPPTPLVHARSKQVVQLHYEKVIPLKQLSSPRLSIAGYRYNPLSGLSGIDPLVNKIELVNLQKPDSKPLILWNANTSARLTHIAFSPDGRYLSAVQTQPDTAAKLVLFHLPTQKKQTLSTSINASMGDPCQWATPKQLLCRVISIKRSSQPTPRITPITMQHHGAPLPTRTYSNLLTDHYSESLFEYHFSSELTYINVDGTHTQTQVPSGVFSQYQIAPDGNHLILRRIELPYSHLVPARRFPNRIEIWNLTKGKRLYNSEQFGFGIDHPGHQTADPNSLTWAPTLPVRASYIEHTNLNPKAPFQLRMATFPFSSAATTVASNTYPIKEHGWTSAGTLWYITETQDKEKIDVFTVKGSSKKRILTANKNTVGNSSRHPIRLDGQHGPALEINDRIFLANDGLDSAFPRPFLESIHLLTGKTQRLFTAGDDAYQPVLAILDNKGEVLLTSHETENQPPKLITVLPDKQNVVYRSPSPYPQLEHIQRERIQYTRKDGVALSATLYRPKNTTNTLLPTLVWIYPHEFNDPKQAEQLNTRQFQFHRIKSASPIAATLAGYAVVVDPTVPIIFDGADNEAYLPQLISSTNALTDYLTKNNISDPKRIAVGGHSYGAFSTANLLIHSDKFAAGIARSGAYNRTLTPFGFQHEKRSFWEASGYYTDISPFFHADKMRKPLLLIHGGVDPNPGTPILQAKRFFHALVGEGATVRFVELPYEEHHYRGKETILHTQWEMLNWLDKHLKPRK